MVIKLFLSLIVISGIIFTANADTIYQWTDQQGAEKFSNEPPPKEVKDYKIQRIPPPDEKNKDTINRRSTYDRMVENASEEADQLAHERKMKTASQKTQKKRIQEENQKKKIQTECTRLEREIDALKKRSLSPTFSKGMQQSQIEAIERQIEKLKK